MAKCPVYSHSLKTIWLYFRLGCLKSSYAICINACKTSALQMKIEFTLLVRIQLSFHLFYRGRKSALLSLQRLTVLKCLFGFSSGLISTGSFSCDIQTNLFLSRFLFFSTSELSLAVLTHASVSRVS